MYYLMSSCYLVDFESIVLIYIDTIIHLYRTIIDAHDVYTMTTVR